MKDLELPQLWLRFDPWPGNLHAAGIAKKKRKGGKKKTSNTVLNGSGEEWAFLFLLPTLGKKLSL